MLLISYIINYIISLPEKAGFSDIKRVIKIPWVIIEFINIKYIYIYIHIYIYKNLKDLDFTSAISKMII